MSGRLRSSRMFLTKDGWRRLRCTGQVWHAMWIRLRRRIRDVLRRKGCTRNLWFRGGSTTSRRRISRSPGTENRKPKTGRRRETRIQNRGVRRHRRRRGKRWFGLHGGGQCRHLLRLRYRRREVALLNTSMRLW